MYIILLLPYRIDTIQLLEISCFSFEYYTKNLYVEYADMPFLMNLKKKHT